jgi:hypothetical protein
MEMLLKLVLKLLSKLEVDTKEGAREILLRRVHWVRLMALTLGGPLGGPSLGAHLAV